MVREHSPSRLVAYAEFEATNGDGSTDFPANGRNLPLFRILHGPLSLRNDQKLLGQGSAQSILDFTGFPAPAAAISSRLRPEPTPAGQQSLRLPERSMPLTWEPPIISGGEHWQPLPAPKYPDQPQGH